MYERKILVFWLKENIKFWLKTTVFDKTNVETGYTRVIVKGTVKSQVCMTLGLKFYSSV